MDMANPGRRREDHPDWKMYAPRWLLVVLVVLFGGVTWAAGVSLVGEVRRTARKVSSIESHQRKQDAEIYGVRETQANILVHMLRYQLAQVRRQGNKAYADDLERQLRDAELAQDRIVRAKP